MSWVYILQGIKNGKFYVGSTSNLRRRIGEHQAGKNRSSKGLLPIRVVFKQKFSDFKTARKIEFRLKGLKRKDYLEKIVRDGFIKMGA